MDDDDDLWGPPFVVEDDSPLKQTLRGCEFWFDFRTDVLEENFQNQRYCEIVWRILNEKKLEKDSVSSGSGGGGSDVVSSDSDKTLSAILPNADTSCAKSSALDDDENTSSISDAQTLDTEEIEIDLETRLKPQEIAANDPLTVKVAEDAVLGNKIEEAEEHSCSSLVSDQVFDPIKQPPESKSSSSAISREDSTLSPLVVGEKANAINEDGELLKDHQQTDDSLQDVVTVSEPFTTETLLEMCDEPDKGRESKRSNPDAVKTLVKDELIINLLTDARKKAGSTAFLNRGSFMIKKRPSSDNNGVNTGFIRNTKQKVGGEAGEINSSTQSIVPTQQSDSTLDSIDQIMSDSVITISDLKSMTGKELRTVAKELKLTHYYKLKKEDLVQRITTKLTDFAKQRMES